MRCAPLWLAAPLMAAVWGAALGQTPYLAVDPMIGTANGGNTFPGASMPFGMVQWSPDTGEGWYLNSDTRIHGFSLTHLSGAGCPAFADLPLLPWSEPPAASRAQTSTESLAFSHVDEQAHPGFYSVKLSDGTLVELAVTERAGMARLRFAPGKRAGLLLNAAGSASSDVHITKLPPVARERDGESLTVAADGSLTATIMSGGFCGTPTHYTLYVAVEPHTKPPRTLLWRDGQAVDGGRAEGKRAMAWMDFGDGPESSEQLVKVGLSYVSEAKAKANLQAEIPGWDFDAVRHGAEESWKQALGLIEIEGGAPAERTIFYTALYHNLLAPSLLSDVDGAYTGFDGKPHHVVAGQHAQYTNFSDWDTYRNTTPLQAWLKPAQSSDMAQSLVNAAEEMGSLPRWAIANDSSYVMGGDSSAVLLPEFYSFGAKGFDIRSALRVLLRGATVPKLGIHDGFERAHLEDYLRLGYLPAGRVGVTWETSASETLEFANDDFAIGQFARAMNEPATAAAMEKQAGSWRNLLDPQTGWIRPRKADGTWIEGFDAEKSLPRVPDAPVPTDQLGFQEGNTYQYTFMVPFDYAGLFHLVGGNAVAEKRLDTFFRKLVCWGEPCFNMANEPDFVTPYAYTFLGKPWKTAEVVKRIEEETFNTTPGGLAGNDDLGATSGVYLWNALGMYPAIPGMAGLVLGAPRFPAAVLHLGTGKVLRIKRTGEGGYVQSVSLNGHNHPSTWLPLDALGLVSNTLEFRMGADPGLAWGVLPKDRPPSLSAR